MASYLRFPLFCVSCLTVSLAGSLLSPQLEIGDAAEFTQEWLYEQLHPAKVVFQQKFKRPMRPGEAWQGYYFLRAV